MRPRRARRSTSPVTSACLTMISNVLPRCSPGRKPLLKVHARFIHRHAKRLLRIHVTQAEKVTCMPSTKHKTQDTRPAPAQIADKGASQHSSVQSKKALSVEPMGINLQRHFLLRHCAPILDACQPARHVKDSKTRHALGKHVLRPSRCSSILWNDHGLCL
jgi:hypothetical protein